MEKKAFETMMARFEQLADKMQMLCLRYGVKKMGKWYDNQDVCRILRISPRTLQTLRDNGTLPFSQINRKIYYRPEDVQNVLVPAEHAKRAKENKPHQKTSKFNSYGLDNENR
jgi:hypothetical protein